MIYGELKSVSILALTRNDRFTVKDMNGIAYEGIKKSEVYTITPGYSKADGPFQVGDKISFKQTLYINSGVVMGIAEKRVAVKTDLLIVEISPEDVIQVIE